MKNVNEFMLLFRMRPSNEQPTAEALHLMHQQWSKFIGDIAAQAKLISTTRLSFEGMQLSSDLSVTEGILVSEGHIVSGNMLITAQDLNEATLMAKQCPILKAGGSVEVRAVQPM